MTHLLATNDFPPKTGGIQNYLWELWRRLPADEFTVLTRPHQGDAVWDAAQDYAIVRTSQRFLLPTRSMRKVVDQLADGIGAGLVVYDPASPLGVIGPRSRHRYAVVLHGAEVTIPGHIPGPSHFLKRTLRNASLIISASKYAEAEAERCAGVLPPTVYVPPGDDVDRFVPMADAAVPAARRRLGLDEDAIVIVGISRLVPRKGFHLLIAAAEKLHTVAGQRIEVVIVGTGREQNRLQKLADQSSANVRLTGRVDDQDLADYYACADISAMLCHNRLGGLEQEGFGIVFLESAAAGTPQVAGNSGGAAEAVAHGETGLVVDDPTSVDQVTAALQTLIDDPKLRKKMAVAGRKRAVHDFSYDLLANRLLTAIHSVDGTTGP